MSYPKELLPKSNYKIIDVANIQDASLIRKSLKDKKSSFDNIGDLKIIAICEKDYDVFGLSANLFAIYDCKHLNYNPCDKAFYSYWYPNESVPSKDDIKFVLLKNVFPIYFPIKELHNQIYPYKKTLPKNNKTGIIFYTSFNVENIRYSTL